MNQISQNKNTLNLFKIKSPVELKKLLKKEVECFVSLRMP